MNEIAERQVQLPNTIEDLSKFVLVGREKLNAVRAEIRAISKIGLAREVYQQKLSEAQDIADAVLDAEVKMGQLISAIPKEQGKRTDIEHIRNGADKSKKEQLDTIGVKPDTANRFETLAKHPEAVEMAKESAREDGRIVTRQDVFNEIKKPHVVNNSGDNEWYTPSEYIAAARNVMGHIDLDPASCEIANRTVGADCIYTAEDDGRSFAWFGNVWLNPPYSMPLIQGFAEKVVEHEFEQAIVLVNNATDTRWFRMMVESADAILFTTGRVKFYKPDSNKCSPLQGQALMYYGENPGRFLEVFSKFGWGVAL